MKILIVEDSALIQRMYGLALPKREHELHTAGNGREALTLLSRHGPFDVVLLDLNMPDMHGVEVLGFVRSNQRFQKLPVVVLTTRDDEASRTAAMNAGATKYLTKPFTPQALLSEVRALIASPVQGAR